jgi:hypothetical protein
MRGGGKWFGRVEASSSFYRYRRATGGSEVPRVGVPWANCGDNHDRLSRWCDDKKFMNYRQTARPRRYFLARRDQASQ